MIVNHKMVKRNFEKRNQSCVFTYRSTLGRSGFDEIETRVEGVLAKPSVATDDDR